MTTNWIQTELFCPPKAKVGGSNPLGSATPSKKPNKTALFPRSGRSGLNRSFPECAKLGQDSPSVWGKTGGDGFYRVALTQHLIDRPSLAPRFWSHVDKSGGDEACWPWNGGKRGQMRYGSFKVASYTSVMAHRVAYALTTGKDPGNMVVCHSCDNPPCCNPKHLWLGTIADNNADKLTKGRAKNGNQSGENNGAAKLSKAQVGIIKGLFITGLNNKQIAAKYGVTHQAISKIRVGRFWKDVSASPIPAGTPP